MRIDVLIMPSTEGFALMVCRLLLELHREVGIAPVNHDKLVRQCYSVLTEKRTFGLFANGGFVGSLGLVRATHYYSDEAYLQDKWFYVRPEYRGFGGFRLLRRGMREADRMVIPLIVDDTHPARAARNRRLVYIPKAYRARVSRQEAPALYWGESDGLLFERDETREQDDYPGLS